MSEKGALSEAKSGTNGIRACLTNVEEWDMRKTCEYGMRDRIITHMLWRTEERGEEQHVCTSEARGKENAEERSSRLWMQHNSCTGEAWVERSDPDSEGVGEAHCEAIHVARSSSEGWGVDRQPRRCSEANRPVAKQPWPRGSLSADRTMLVTDDWWGTNQEEGTPLLKYTNCLWMKEWLRNEVTTEWTPLLILHNKIHSKMESLQNKAFTVNLI